MREQDTESFLSFDEERCAGCFICVLICSHHHKKVFDREISSLQVKKSDFWSGYKIRLRYFAKAKREHISCDRCQDEDMPLCVKCCPVKALRIGKNQK